jgi:2Fe-2S ferredoxin
MPKVTYIAHDGTVRSVEVAAGRSVMQGAVDNNIPGIDADCGGECACATCHVFIEEAWREATGTAGEIEDTMLGFAATRQPNSRLACQITVTAALDGLIVRTPEAQH